MNKESEIPKKHSKQIKSFQGKTILIGIEFLSNCSSHLANNLK
jgi:hypothetical protein